VYDADGNVTQKTVDGTTTTYIYDYANRLTVLGVLGATTTYAYDAFGQRVLQTGTTMTYLYPFKWYSVASSTGTGAKFATTTDYVFNGDSLVATVDQQTASGNATGTAKTRYIHPDHLGSTNVVTDENDKVVQTLDYYPYGSTRISSGTSTNERRKYIGQFTDDSGLSYLNARYYESARGQFVSQDPTFLALGNPDQIKQFSQQDQQTFLSSPQQLNSYSYAEDNPITHKDPSGNAPSFRDLVEYGHIAKTAYDTGTFTLFPDYQQSPEELNSEAFTAISGIVTSGLSYLAGEGGGYALSGGMLAVDGVQWGKDRVCASLVSCHSYFDTGVRVTLLDPNGPQIKITPVPSSGGNGPTQGSVRGGGAASNSGSGGSGSAYSQQVSLYQTLIAILQGYIDWYNNSNGSSNANSSGSGSGSGSSGSGSGGSGSGTGSGNSGSSKH
jgi:RHS repeat-associated protein